MVRFTSITGLAAVGLLVASSSLAQSNALIGIGVGVSADRLTDSDSWNRSINWTVFRIPRPEHLGIAWDVGSQTDVVSIGDIPGVQASLRARHLLFGPAYTWRVGRTEVTASAVVGPSFNRIRLADGAPESWTASTKTSWVARPDATVWVDLAPRLGLKLSTYYQVAPTDLRVTTDGTDAATRWQGRRLHVQTGLVFGVY